MDNDLSEILIAFASELPQTIRADTLVFVVTYGLDEGTPDDFDFVTQITDHLRSRGGMRLFSSTLRLAAAFEYVLERQKKMSIRNEGLFEYLAEHGPENLRDPMRQSALRRPMSDRHLDQALAKWRQLRATTLSPQSLRDFEDRCLRPRGVR